MSGYKLCLSFVWILISTLACGSAFGQDPCLNYLTTTKQFGRTTIKSKSQLAFRVKEGLMGELKFSNLGLPLTIQISLTFKEGKVYSADVGELLNIGFMDDSHVEILSSSKRLGTGAVLYTLIRAKKDKIMSYEDKILYEKLRDIRIDSLRFSVNNVSHELIVSQPKADSIRNIVGCLIEHHITIDQKP